MRRCRRHRHRPARQWRWLADRGHRADRSVHRRPAPWCRSATTAATWTWRRIPTPTRSTTARWPSWSTATAPRRRRSSPAPSRTTARGIIIGEPTFGKGTVQQLIELGEYLSGTRGHRPPAHDHRPVFPRQRRQHPAQGCGAGYALSRRSARSTTASARCENALPWDSIKPAIFKSLVTRTRWIAVRARHAGADRRRSGIPVTSRKRRTL